MGLKPHEGKLRDMALEWVLYQDLGWVALGTYFSLSILDFTSLAIDKDKGSGISIDEGWDWLHYILIVTARP